MPDSDSGLHVSMRLLLGIIAGLIIADLLKVVVKTVGLPPDLTTFRLDDFAFASSALLFVTRVLIDNSLYYNRPDAKTHKASYPVRLFLIICDLLSYSLCYFIVVHTENLTTGSEYDNRVRAVAYAIVLIEGLHFTWCSAALAGLKIPTHSDDYKPRRSWLIKWAWLSGSFAAFGAMVLFFGCYRRWAAHDWLGFNIVFSTASVIAYGFVMKTEYLGDWAAPISTSRMGGDGGKPVRFTRHA